MIRDEGTNWYEHQKNCPGGSKSDSTSGAKEKEGSESKKEHKDKKGPDSKKEQKKSNGKPKTGNYDGPAGFPDFYASLQVPRWSCHEYIVQAARRRRIEVHPDKLKKPGMTAEELKSIDQIAMEVGRAADILTDPSKRSGYERELTDHLKNRKA
ncbi:MAG: hypothetical protein Q9170_001322 [Blastenia crenularia]